MNNVPRLDLAPKLKRPLSLKNPRDYFLLLYWVFFFPQAVRWYVEKYIDVSAIKELKTLKEKKEYILVNTILLHLTIQTFILIILPILLTFFLDKSILDYPVPTNFSKGSINFNDFNTNTLSLEDLRSILFDFFQRIWPIIIDLVKGLFKIIFSPIIISIILFLSHLYFGKLPEGITLGILFSILSSIESIIVQGFPWFHTFAICANCMLILNNKNKTNIFIYGPLFILSTFPLGIIVGFILIPLFILKNGFLLGLTFSLLLMIFPILFLGISWFIFNVRLDNWLIFLLLNLFNKYNLLPSVTLLPSPGLYSKIIKELQSNWEIGIDNVNQLLKYTMQIIPVTLAIHRVLNKTPEEKLFQYVNQLVNKLYNLELIYIYKEPLRFLIKRFFVYSIIFSIGQLLLSPFSILYDVLSIFFSKNLADKISNNTINFFQKNTIQTSNKNLDSKKNTPNYNSQHFIASGFWYLYKKEPEKSKEEFSFVQHLTHGQELFILADIFSNLINNDFFNSLNYISSVEIPKDKLIREQTWQVIRQLKQIAEDSLLVENSQSRSIRSLANNRAIGELEKILENPNSLPELERAMIIDIAQDWQKKLAQNASVIGDNSISEPIPNPYVIGDPVIGQLFVGREDIIRQLKEIWLAKNQIQSVILYGHRRMGKTSILMNISDKLGSKVKLAYINLNGLGDILGVEEVFMAITDAISEELNIAPPDDQDLSKYPNRTFRRYLEQIARNNLTEYSLIIALDEFENIENLINTKKISSGFLDFLRSMMQMSPKLAFTFAGLHTLEEMTTDYFQPFYAGTISIKVNFLSEGATRQLLANPNDEFPLDYQAEALDTIYQLTFGQPYLVQLIGFFLVRHYNDQVFEMGKPRDPFLTIEDVNTIINNPEFFKNGRYYFTGVWGQASQNAPAQQEILRAIAPYPQGLDILNIEAITGIDQTTLEIALKTLERHDVIQEKIGKWSIIVELFRRWVEQEKTSNS